MGRKFWFSSYLEIMFLTFSGVDPLNEHQYHVKTDYVMYLDENFYQSVFMVKNMYFILLYLIPRIVPEWRTIFAILLYYYPIITCAVCKQ